MIYGHNGTIHDTQHLHVETRHGKVVAVWFRCCMIPFEQVLVDNDRAREMAEANERGASKFKLNAVDIESE